MTRLSLTPTLVLALIVVLAVGLRLGLNLFHDSMLGVDGGAYLLSVNTVLGDEPTGAGFPRPPLAPGWLLVPFVKTFGIDAGYKIWAALFSICPLLPIYLLARKYVGEWPAVFGVGVAALDWYHAEMMVTGALPLIGFGLIGSAWWSMGELAEKFSKRNAIILILSIGLIPWINQTSAGLALITLPAWLLFLLVFHRGETFSQTWAFRSDIIWHIVPFALVGGFLAAYALPWYMEVLPGSSILHYQGPWLYPAPYWDFAWYQMSFTLPLSVFVAWKADDYRLKTLGAMGVLLSVMLPWLSYDETIINIPYRARYLMAVVFYPSMVFVVMRYWIPKLREWFPRLHRPLIVGATALTVLALLAGFNSQHKNQTFYADMATPATQTALNLLKETDPTANVATNSFTLSLWVAALNKVKSPFAFTAPPPERYVSDDENLRCLLNWVPGCDPVDAQQKLNVGYILIDERFPDWGETTGRHPANYLAPPNQWEVTAAAPWLELVYAEGTTRLWRIRSNTKLANGIP